MSTKRTQPTNSHSSIQSKDVKYALVPLNYLYFQTAFCGDMAKCLRRHISIWSLTLTLLTNDHMSVSHIIINSHFLTVTIWHDQFVRTATRQ